jgi:hypothetical protein
MNTREFTAFAVEVGQYTERQVDYSDQPIRALQHRFYCGRHANGKVFLSKYSHEAALMTKDVAEQLSELLKTSFP